MNRSDWTRLWECFHAALELPVAAGPSASGPTPWSADRARFDEARAQAPDPAQAFHGFVGADLVDNINTVLDPHIGPTGD